MVTGDRLVFDWDKRGIIYLHWPDIWVRINIFHIRSIYHDMFHIQRNLHDKYKAQVERCGEL